MSSAFRRKVYGKVKPVPKAKIKAPERPAVNDLRSIYIQIKKSPASQLNDLLSEALIWWQNATSFCQWKYKKLFPLEAARAFTTAQEFVGKGRCALDNAEKARCFITALEKYQRYAASVLKTPSIKPYVQKSKEVTKKVKIRTKQLTSKFDSVLTLLAQCLDEPAVSFEVNDIVTDTITGNQIDRKWDHALSTVIYSRAKVVEMKKQIFHQGLLSVVLEEADFVARGISLSPGLGKGSFIPNPELHLKNYKVLLERFEAFAHTTVAPKMLVKREKKPKKKGGKINAK